MEDMLMLFETLDLGFKGYINLNDLISAALLKDKVCERNFTISAEVCKEVEELKSTGKQEKIIKDLLAYFDRTDALSANKPDEVRLSPEDFFNLVLALYD